MPGMVRSAQSSAQEGACWLHESSKERSKHPLRAKRSGGGGTAQKTKQSS